MEMVQERSGIFVPRTIATRRQMLRCSTCGTDFPLEQRLAWERHIVKCERVNSEIAEAELAAKEDSYLTSPADPEKFRHFRNGGT